MAVFKKAHFRGVSTRTVDDLEKAWALAARMLEGLAIFLARIRPWTANAVQMPGSRLREGDGKT